MTSIHYYFIIIIDNDNKKDEVMEMAESRTDLILHPIRIRIIQTLVTGEHMTTQQLAEMLPDVPQATMYRHLNKLLQAKLIEVVERNQVRGTVEKVYALAANGADGILEDEEKISPEKHMQMFLKFAASLITDFGDYLKQDDYDLFKDGVTFRQAQFYLTDEEYMQMLLEIRENMSRYMGKKPGQGRRRRMMSTIVIPGKASETDKDKSEEESHDDAR
ncbi:helix-turn-helix domain-containing protein [Paenibacillus baekrokdamisoli]|uniref:helix-turn-helix domain-containing protein n=1 Tax=Paenibacillus baekrokdamisoli TaxID=1712516 RepID=UPI001E35453C|nr:helix-turn-helix domain-containing protein [Paenibacillus baekrokdamisoli]